MNRYDDEYGHEQVKTNNYRPWVVGAGALLLAVLLGYVDAAILSGVKSTYSVTEMAAPVRIAVVLTVAVALLAVGAVASFLSAFRPHATVGGEAEGWAQAHEPVSAEEIDVFNVRKAA